MPLLQKGEEERREKERGKVKQEIEIVGEKAEASIWVDLYKRVFNCMKTPTTTKIRNMAWGFKKNNTGSFVSGNQFKKQLRLRIQIGVEQDFSKLGEERRGSESRGRGCRFSVDMSQERK